VQVTSETVAPREVVLHIVPDPDTIERAMRQAARDITRQRPLRGYRPGRAPYSMVERAFGRPVILNQALNRIAPDLYHEAIHEADIQPYQQGEIDIETEDPLVLKINVSLVPEVKLGNYAEMTIEPRPEVAITDGDIDEQIDMLRRQHAEVVPVKRPLQMGDQVTASIWGTVDGNEVQRQETATLDLTEYMRPEGFAEALVGAETGDTREFSLTYPEDEPNRDLAGKKVDYRVVIGEVRELVLPEADDSFAKTVGDYETIDQVRASVAEELKEQREAQARADERLEAVEQLIAASEIEYPRAAVEREIDRAIANQRARAQRMGFSLDSYLRLTNRTEQDLRDEIEADAINGLLQRLVLLEYVRQEDLRLTDDEGNAAVNNYANHIAMSYGDQAQAMLQQAMQNGAFSLAIEDAMVMKAAQYLADRMAGRPLPEPEAETPAEVASEDAGSEDAGSEDAGSESAGSEDTSAAEAAEPAE
jgi:trigger factor